MLWWAISFHLKGCIHLQSVSPCYHVLALTISLLAILTKPLSEHPLLRTLGKWTWICLTNIGSFLLTLRVDHAKDTERGMGWRRELELNSLWNLISTEGSWPLFKQSQFKCHPQRRFWSWTQWTHLQGPELKRLRQENIKIENRLDCIVRIYFKALQNTTKP